MGIDDLVRDEGGPRGRTSWLVIGLRKLSRGAQPWIGCQRDWYLTLLHVCFGNHSPPHHVGQDLQELLQRVSEWGSWCGFQHVPAVLWVERRQQIVDPVNLLQVGDRASLTLQFRIIRKGVEDIGLPQTQMSSLVRVVHIHHDVFNLKVISGRSRESIFLRTDLVTPEQLVPALVLVSSPNTQKLVDAVFSDVLGMFLDFAPWQGCPEREETHRGPADLWTNRVSRRLREEQADGE